MASVFVYHVVGDLTVGKPELVEFSEGETVEAAIRAIGESTEGGIPVWKKRSLKTTNVFENAEMRQKRFVGILSSLDIVAFLARQESLANQEKAMKTPVSEVLVPNNSLLKEVDPATRLIDALEMMKQGVMRLLVPKSIVWRGMSKRFSVLYEGKWLKNADSSNSLLNTNGPSSSTTTTIRDKFHCLSREDIIRFLIGCLGALAPLPLSSITSLGVINPDYCFVEATCPAMDASQKLPLDPCAIAVVENLTNGQHKIIGEISACKLWKCDYLAAGWALANLSAGQFVTGVEDNESSLNPPDFSVGMIPGNTNVSNGWRANRQRRFSSSSIGFFSNPANPTCGVGRSMYRGRSAPLTCRVTSTMAAVMAQMLSHRASHVWVTEADNEDTLAGVVSYVDILGAVTRQPSSFVRDAQ